MHVFPPSTQRSPLADRSNSMNASSSTTTESLKPVLDINEPARRKTYFPRLDSSENVPSDHSSLYDAPRARSPTQTDDGEVDSVLPSGTTYNSEGSDHNRQLKPGARFVNRPHGTPLFAIAEQKSLATLRSTVSKKALSIHSKESAGATEREEDRTDGRNTSSIGWLVRSIDEAELQRYRA